MTPTDLFAGYQLLAAAEAAPSQGIFIPLADLMALSAAEADETTGDAREVLRAINDAAFEGRTAFVDGGGTAPTGLTLARTISTVLTGTSVRYRYQNDFDVLLSPSNLSMV